MSATTTHTQENLEPEPLITFDGLSRGDIGLFIRSDSGAGQPSSFNAFRRDAADPPCRLHGTCAELVPGDTSFALGRVTRLENHEDGSSVAMIEPIHYDDGGVRAAYAPPDHPRPDDAISFRLGAQSAARDTLFQDRIVLFFRNSNDEYVAYQKPGPSHWFLGRESKAEIPSGDDAPLYVFGRIIIASERVASAERNPFHLDVETHYFVAMIEIQGYSPR